MRPPRRAQAWQLFTPPSRRAPRLLVPDKRPLITPQIRIVDPVARVAASVSRETRVHSARSRAAANGMPSPPHDLAHQLRGARTSGGSTRRTKSPCGQRHRE
jgi:hypothetical protein